MVGDNAENDKKKKNVKKVILYNEEPSPMILTHFHQILHNHTQTLLKTPIFVRTYGGRFTTGAIPAQEHGPPPQRASQCKHAVLQNNQQLHISSQTGTGPTLQNGAW